MLGAVLREERQELRVCAQRDVGRVEREIVERLRLADERLEEGYLHALGPARRAGAGVGQRPGGPAEIERLDRRDADIEQAHRCEHQRQHALEPRRVDLLRHVLGDEVVAHEDVAERDPHVLQDSAVASSRAHRLERRHLARPLQAEEHVRVAAGKQQIGVEEVRAAERVEQGAAAVEMSAPSTSSRQSSITLRRSRRSRSHCGASVSRCFVQTSSEATCACGA